jgi:poly-gamma-glutamate synthesis protein (capsule biosynthesis protein)
MERDMRNMLRVQSRKQPRKRLVYIVVAVLVLGLAAGVWALHDKTPKPVVIKKTPATTNATTKTDTADTISFIATGDMLPHDSVDSNAKTSSGTYDYTPFFAQVHSYLTSADMAFCNQESPSNPNASVSGYPTFNAPVAFPQALSHEGCNIINLANNHADDKGQAGIDATKQVWTGLPTLAVAGTSSNAAEQQQVAYFTVKGVKFAFLSYAQCSNDKSVSSYGLNIFSQTLAGAQIAEAKQHADMIITAMHSCDEDKSTEDIWQDQTARYFADQGVSIVVGTGPHWLQTAQRLPRAGGGTTAVWYSLGNFLGTQLDVNGLIGGIAAMKIDIKTKAVVSMGFMPTYIHYEWTAAQKAADDEAARHNIMIYPLDLSAAPLANSQDNTTVEAQTTRVTQLMTQRTPVTMLTSKTFSNFIK